MGQRWLTSIVVLLLNIHDRYSSFAKRWCFDIDIEESRVWLRRHRLARQRRSPRGGLRQRSAS